jgi:hypothetical protein
MAGMKFDIAAGDQWLPLLKAIAQYFPNAHINILNACSFLPFSKQLVFWILLLHYLYHP